MFTFCYCAAVLEISMRSHERVAFLVIGLLALLGALAFIGYRLGDTPEETQRLLGLKSLSDAKDSDSILRRQ